MNEMKQLNSEPCFVGSERKAARLFTFFEEAEGKMVFVVRDGFAGDGEELAREECKVNEKEQFDAIVKIRKKLRGLRFETTKVNPKNKRRLSK
jgi:hypothetical protein